MAGRCTRVVSVQGDGESGRGRRSGRGVRGAICVVQENNGQSLVGRTESFDCDPSVQAGFVQLSYESAVPVLMRCTVFAWLSIKV